MFAKSWSLVPLALLSTTAVAAPTELVPKEVAPIDVASLNCTTGRYLVDVYGHKVVKFRYNGFGTLLGCAPDLPSRKDLEARQEPVFFCTAEDDICIEGTGDYVEDRVFKQHPNDLGYAFGSLWRRARERCGMQGCDGNLGWIRETVSYSDSDEYGYIEMTLDGSFNVDRRDLMLDLAEDAFEDSIETYQLNPNIEQFVGRATMRSWEIRDEANFGDLTVTFQSGMSSRGGCPEAMQRILNLGTLVPKYGVAAGIIGLGCT